MKPGDTIHGLKSVEVYCVETGETVEGVAVASIRFPASGVVEATLEVFPVEIEGTDRILYMKDPRAKTQD
jgi:hypothetical protein